MRRQRAQGAGLKRLLALLSLAALAACTMVLAPEQNTPKLSPPADQGALPPPAPREFRAAWVATVANIDWPSQSGLPVAKQQAEIRAILDQAQRLKLNAIVLQVRPSADAIYPSALEPWSEYLNGAQGQPPEPF